MSAISQDPALVGAAGAPTGIPTGGLLRQVLREQKAASIGVALILVFVILAVGAPLFAPYSPVAQSCAVVRRPLLPSLARL